MREVIDTKEMAELLGVSPATVRRWAAVGILKGKRRRGRWTFNHAAIIHAVKTV